MSITKLSDVKDFDDFKALYEGNNLSTDESKIAFLINAMKIKAIRYEEEESPGTKLLGLEEFALMHPWHCQENQ
ncbi:MAG: hypothetical protein LBP55_05230 [Candidatus Adiutrix sp.]|jgi:hypothetical protein|nr:hypothetical protein [Candidatus Adiutrix sp.]